MDNLHINGSLVQKWMKKTASKTRRRKARQIAQGITPSSPLTSNDGLYPRSKSRTEDMFDGKRMYIIGFIQQANKKEMAKLRKDITKLFNRNMIRKLPGSVKKNVIMEPSHSRLIYLLMDDNSTRNNTQYDRTKGWILSLLTAYNKKNMNSSRSLLPIIYDCLPANY